MLCFAALFIMQTIISIWKKYKQNTGNADLLASSNYYFIKKRFLSTWKSGLFSTIYK